MDLMNTRLDSGFSALDKLEEALRLKNPSSLERDGAIQRFEFTFESFWKAARVWLESSEGFSCNSPRGCIRTLAQVGILDPAETVSALAMVDDRNLTVHTYHEETARAIFERLPGHAGIIRKALELMRKRNSA